MITKQQAIEAQEFHQEGCKRAVGPRGGVTTTIKVWRRNGKTQTWARSPERFRVPVKYGMYGYDAITEQDAGMVHVPEDCPLGKEEHDSTPPL